jgi:hypothetical protein
VILGHLSSGAVTAAARGGAEGNGESIMAEIEPAVDIAREATGCGADLVEALEGGRRKVSPIRPQIDDLPAADDHPVAGLKESCGPRPQIIFFDGCSEQLLRLLGSVIFILNMKLDFRRIIAWGEK